MTIVHTFNSPKSDPADTTKVGASKWNADHTVTALVWPMVTINFSAGSPNLDASLGNTFKLTLTGNATLTISNPPAAGFSQRITLIVIQNGTGGWVLTYPASFVGEMDMVGDAILPNARVTQYFDFDGTSLWISPAGGTIS